MAGRGRSGRGTTPTRRAVLRTVPSGGTRTRPVGRDNARAAGGAILPNRRSPASGRTARVQKVRETSRGRLGVGRMTSAQRAGTTGRTARVKRVGIGRTVRVSRVRTGRTAIIPSRIGRTVRVNRGRPGRTATGHPARIGHTDRASPARGDRSGLVSRVGADPTRTGRLAVIGRTAHMTTAGAGHTSPVRGGRIGRTGLVSRMKADLIATGLASRIGRIARGNLAGTGRTVRVSRVSVGLTVGIAPGRSSAAASSAHPIVLVTSAVTRELGTTAIRTGEAGAGRTTRAGLIGRGISIAGSRGVAMTGSTGRRRSPTSAATRKRHPMSRRPRSYPRTRRCPVA